MNYKEELSLTHFGVMGMRWGQRRATMQSLKDGTYSSKKTKSLQRKVSIAKESAKEWDEMAGYSKERGKQKQAIQRKANAKFDRIDAKTLATKAKRSSDVDKAYSELAKSGKKVNSRNMNKALDQLTGTEISKGKQMIRDMLYSQVDQVRIKENQYVEKGKGW